MSISLNNHENRIKALELALKTPFTQTMLFNGSSNQRVITLNDDIRKYNAVFLYYYSSVGGDNHMIGYSVIIPSVMYNTNLGCPFSNGKTQALIRVHENKIYFEANYQDVEHLKYVVGLKWRGYKLWNFIQKISSLYYSILKTISLSFIGGEVI